jgi:ABC-type multidrug transport system ATPase subunit
VLSFEGVTAHAPGGRRLLDDVSFAVQQGWMVAVVGPTGAGKTSLARALTGALALRTGRIRLGGVDLAEDPDVRQRIAYVPQDDVLHGGLGLARTVGYAASIRAPRGTDRKARAQRVESALTELGLEHHADVQVASLSGGQRKRANIAAELVGGPEVIVLDEPTSGLDPGYEKSVLSRLRQLADTGRTVIAITHSVAAIQQCDRVLYLAAGGRVAYFGPPRAAARYFGRTDTADVFLALDTDYAEEGTDWKDRFRSHPAYSRYVRPILEPTAAPAGPVIARPARVRWPVQLVTLVRRQIDLLRADRRHLALLLLQGPLLGILLRLVLTPASLAETARVAVAAGGSADVAARTLGALIALSATWLGVSSSIREVVKERHIVRREVGAGLSPSAFVAAKALVLGTATAVQAAILTAIVCYGQVLPTHGTVLGSARVELMVAGALAGVAATMLGLLLSALVSTPDKALALLPISLVAELALAGAWAAHIHNVALVGFRTLLGAHWGVQAITGTVWDDPGQWAAALAWLGLLSGAAIAGTVALVNHRNAPAVLRPGLGHRVGHGIQVARERGDLVLGSAAACCILVAIGALVHVAASAEPDTGLALSHDTVPVATTPTTAAVAEEAPAAPVTTVAPVVAAPTLHKVAATTATTLAPVTPTTSAAPPPADTAPLVLPSSPGVESSSVKPAPTTTTTAASSSSWMEWVSYWYAVQQYQEAYGR